MRSSIRRPCVPAPLPQQNPTERLLVLRRARALCCPCMKPCYVDPPRARYCSARFLDEVVLERFLYFVLPVRRLCTALLIVDHLSHPQPESAHGGYHIKTDIRRPPIHAREVDVVEHLHACEPGLAANMQEAGASESEPKTCMRPVAGRLWKDTKEKPSAALHAERSSEAVHCSSLDAQLSFSQDTPQSVLLISGGDQGLVWQFLVSIECLCQKALKHAVRSDRFDPC